MRMASAQTDISLHYSQTVSLVVNDTDQRPESSFIGYDFSSAADFFQNQFCQSVWIQIRPNFMSGLIWVQTVCNGYQQMTQVVKELMKPFINALSTYRGMDIPCPTFST